MPTPALFANDRPERGVDGPGEDRFLSVVVRIDR